MESIIGWKRRFLTTIDNFDIKVISKNRGSRAIYYTFISIPIEITVNCQYIVVKIKKNIF